MRKLHGKFRAQEYIIVNLSIVWKLRLQILPVLLLVLVSAKANVSHPTHGAWNIPQRGGGMVSDTDDNNSRNNEDTPDESMHKEILNDMRFKQRIPDLFQLADDLKSDTGSIATNDFSGPPTSLEGGRGGAMVKEKPARQYQWLSSFEKTIFAPLSARLSRETSRTTGPVVRAGSNTYDAVTNAKDFWLNTWVGNMPDEVHDSKEIDQNVNSKEIESMPSPQPDNVDLQLIVVRSDSSKQRNVEIIEPDDQDTEIQNRKLVTDNKVKKVDSSSNDERTAGRKSAEKLLLPNDGELRNVQNDESEDMTDKTTDLSVSEIVSDETSPSFTFDQLTMVLGQSNKFRSFRKATARVTGIHGFVSGKYRQQKILLNNESDVVQSQGSPPTSADITTAEEKVNYNIPISSKTSDEKSELEFHSTLKEETNNFKNTRVPQSTRAETRRKELERKARLKEIEKQILASQQRLFELASERDVLHQRPNPLWNYTVNDDQHHRKTNDTVGSISLAAVTRQFNFPSEDTVETYLEMLFSTGRIVKMNHSALWQTMPTDEDDDDDDWYMPTKYYGSAMSRKKDATIGSVQYGSWFLRHGLGEKISETAENSAYKAVCQSVMSLLARSLSSLHGINVMGFSEIRLTMEQTPTLPRLGGILPESGADYRRDPQYMIQSSFHRGAQRKTKMQSTKRRSLYESFIQRDAVVETLLLQCQIAAPLMKMFPLLWQRAILANIVTLITAIISDFCEGIEFHILGHRLSFSFSPLTEDDLLRGLVQGKMKGHRHSSDKVHFEAAVLATASEIGNGLKILDRWHERALGGGIVRTQIANLIARLVLTLVEDVLEGAKIGLWTAHAGGPRLISSLEYMS